MAIQNLVAEAVVSALKGAFFWLIAEDKSDSVVVPDGNWFICWSYVPSSSMDLYICMEYWNIKGEHEQEVWSILYEWSRVTWALKCSSSAVSP